MCDIDGSIEKEICASKLRVLGASLAILLCFSAFNILICFELMRVAVEVHGSSRDSPGGAAIGSGFHFLHPSMADPCCSMYLRFMMGSSFHITSIISRD